MPKNVQKPNQRSNKSTEPEIVHLSEKDGEVLNSILAARATDSGLVPTIAGSRDRVVAMQQLLECLDDDPAPPPTDLVQRTLARVEEARQQHRFTEQVQMLAEPRRTIGIGWRQLIAAASIFLIAASLLIPALEHNRDQAHQIVGASHLGSAGIAFQSYADDFNQRLPQLAVRPGEKWVHIGQTTPSANANRPVNSNTAHLYLLIRRGYTTPEQLACPGNPHVPAPGELTRQDHDWQAPEQVSYSYQNQYGRHRIRVDRHAHQPVLADRNPIFVTKKGRILYDPTVPHNAPSRAHRGRGQNVLLLHGAVLFTVDPTDPRTGTDNIWVAKGHQFYRGNEVPADASDTFLAP